MPYGYNGKILHVDLTTGKLEVETPEEAFYRKYLGGSAMGMHYILRDMPKGADPLGPENVLTLMAGVTTGAAIIRSESHQCECQVADQRRHWRFAGRRVLPGRAEICRIRWDCDQREDRRSLYICSIIEGKL